MKLTAITTALSTAIILAIATPIAAEEVAPAQTKAEPDVFCAAMGRMAEAIMLHRQSGTPMSDVMAMIETDNEIVRTYTRAIVKDAYNLTQFITDEMQADAIKRFRNASEALCFAKFDKP